MFIILNSYYVNFLLYVCDVYPLIILFMKLTISEFKRKCDYFLTFSRLWYLFTHRTDNSKAIYQVDILFTDNSRITTYLDCICRYSNRPIKSIYFSVVDDFSYSVSLKHFRDFLLSCNTSQLKIFMRYQRDLFNLYPFVYNDFLDFVKASIGDSAFIKADLKPIDDIFDSDLPF